VNDHDHDHWIALGVPATLVHAYAYCVSQSISWHDDWDYASLILIHLFGVHLGVWGETNDTSVE
jgi:hypothetical protein